jgi:acetoin utilization protein AcuB
MNYLVKDWMSKPVIVVDADSSVSHALTLMRRRRIHSLVVDLGDASQSYGIVTTTDIRDKIIVPEVNPAETTVRQIMTAPVITAKQEWTLKECSITMQKGGFHHLPVAGDHGEIVGMISDTDIFFAAEEIGWGGH